MTLPGASRSRKRDRPRSAVQPPLGDPRRLARGDHPHPHAADRHAVLRLPAHGPRLVARARQASDGRDRKRRRRDRPRDDRGRARSTGPPDPQRRRPRHRDADRAPRRRQARDRHVADLGAPDRQRDPHRHRRRRQGHRRRQAGREGDRGAYPHCRGSQAAQCPRTQRADLRAGPLDRQGSHRGVGPRRRHGRGPRQHREDRRLADDRQHARAPAPG